ncbi:MAG: Eco57I restriction-modification methylase domain-containing protein, partial [Halobacteriaceae archaeon]
MAVDPAMLGKIYESLIAEQERGEAGIFYTPRIEVDLMSRLALYEQFVVRAGNPGEQAKGRIVEFIFTEPQEWNPEDVGESKELEKILHNLRIVDPACGSGAFLVGMKQVLSELYRKLGINPDYSLKEKIINENLYGVDIKDWAVRVAEFRLWLSLVETEDSLPEQRPILPNFSFKLRVGDSILQALEGDEVSFEDIQRKATGEVYQQIEALEDLKDRFFDGETDLRKEIREKQKSVLIAHVESRIQSLKDDTKTQRTLGGSETESSKKESKSAKQRISKLKSLKDDLSDADANSFLWERDFLEVMLDGGFDIAIGNPPYVRQEDIINQGINPKLIDNMSSSKQKNLKDEYKSKLQSYVERTYNIRPYLRSDLYLPFFFKGMEILKEHGTLVFVTSNSWLDVDYGVRLQEGLLRNSEINRIFDNRTQRTFVEADVNTIITSLNKSSNEILKGETDFSAIYRPYNELVDVTTMKQLLTHSSNDKEIIDFGTYQLDLEETEAFRKISVEEASLWKQGGGSISDVNGSRIQDVGEDNSDVRLPQGSYSTGKWGKFLRAPNIYFQIVGNSSNNFERLTDIASIQRGIRSGANQFFYLPNKHFNVEVSGKELQLISADSGEVEFQIPKEYWMQEGNKGWIPNYLLKNSRGFQNPLVDQDDLEIGSSLRYLLIINDPKQDLDNNTLEYVKWGENHETEACPHCRKSSPIPDSCSSSGEGWFDISPMLRRGDILPMQNIDRRHAYWVPKERTFIDQRLHGIEAPDKIDR